jgi:excisionase family DNA binding protein
VAAQRKGGEAPSYLLPAEVAVLLSVSPKTVSRWAKEGKLPFMKTLGGHRRYPRPRSGSSSTSSGRSQQPELAEFLIAAALHAPNRPIHLPGSGPEPLVARGLPLLAWLFELVGRTRAKMQRRTGTARHCGARAPARSVWWGSLG